MAELENSASDAALTDVFISYRTKDPDLTLARNFKGRLTEAGYQPFLAADDIRWGEGWPERIDNALRHAKVFLLLLSAESAESEMVIEEVRRARAFYAESGNQKPLLLPLRLNLSMHEMLNYDLDGYLGRIQQRAWTSPADTEPLAEELLRLLSSRRSSEWGSHQEITTDGGTPEDGSKPLPVAEPETPQGQVDVKSKFYVVRPPIEETCLHEIARNGSLIRIKAPRQMGKTSLLARVLAHAQSLEYRRVSLSFQLADAEVFQNFDSFVHWFCSAVAWKLGVDNTVDRYASLSGSKMRCTAFFSDLLRTSAHPLALGLDEVDLVFDNRNIAKNFFGMLRAWHEEGKSSDLWKKLRMVIAHSTEVYVPLDINESPFNVGLPIALPEFDRGQVLDVARRHGLSWGFGEADNLMESVGGHPYLVRVALYQLTRSRKSLAELLSGAATDAGLFGDHLRRHLWNLHSYADLGRAMGEVVSSKRPVDISSDQGFKLDSMGLVRRVDGGVVPRCKLYRDYFLSHPTTKTP